MTSAVEVAHDSVTVVIATFRTSVGPLAQVVDSYLGQGADEVVVVLDGPQPASRAALAALVGVAGDRLVVHELATNVGQPLAKLHGVRNAGSRIVLTADDDILPADGVVDRQRVLHTGREDLVVVGHIPLVDPGGEDGGVSARIFDAEYRAVIERWEREPETVLQGMYGGLVSVSRSLFLQAHEYKTTVALPYFEDLDLGLRLAAVGGVGVFDVHTAGQHLYRKSLAGFIHESRVRRRSLALLHQRWSAVPTYTRVPDTPLERCARRAYQRIRAVPGVSPVAERALLVCVRTAARTRSARTEEFAARLLRGVLEAAETTASAAAR